MQKISRIVPGSARVSGVDLKSASAVRPGAPSFGRPVGESTESVRDGQTTAQRANGLREEMETRRKGIGEQPEIVKNLTEQFFMQRSSLPGMEELPKEEVVGAEPPPPSARKDFVPPGSYLNVEA